MAVLERSALADSPLADLHAIASELGVDGFRRLRKDELVDAILARQGGEEADAVAEEAAPAAEEDELVERPRRRGGRGRGAKEPTAAREPEPDEEQEEPVAEARPRRERTPRGESAEPRPRRERAGRERGGREERGAREERRGAPEPEERGPERTVEGTIELMPNGSAFVRVAPPDASDEDVYVSAAQVRRCELVAGDRVSGPVRPPRRSERYASLVRVATINGASADEAAEGVRYDELPAAFPSERLELGAEDPTVKAIEWLTPIGKGSRMTIVGPPRSGKSETLRRLAESLAGLDGIECTVVLAGVRPEELAEWSSGPSAPAAALSFAASADAQAQAVEHAIDHAKRVAARGGDAIVLLDTVDGLSPHAARKALAAARNILDGGSLTVIATATAPLGGETTVVALDAEQAGAGRFPAIDLLASGTLRPELLVGEAGAAAIAEARVEAGE